MSVTLLWSDRAKRRMVEVGEFLAARDPEAAARVVGDLFDRVEILAQQPQLGIVFPGSPTDNVRIMYFNKYRVYYLYDSDAACVTVLTVRHGSQAPLDLARALDEEEP